MALLQIPYSYSLMAAQLLALCILHIALQWLLPIVGATLIEGMLLWNDVSIIFCWCIQNAFIAVAIELRETLVKRAQHWLSLFPRRYFRWNLLLVNLPVWLVFSNALWVLLKIPTIFSFAVVTEIILLLLLVWGLSGAAVPMSAKRFYVFFFHWCKPAEDNQVWK